jgi:hypothetical protein
MVQIAIPRCGSLLGLAKPDPTKNDVFQFARSLLDATADT